LGLIIDVKMIASEENYTSVINGAARSAMSELQSGLAAFNKETLPHQAKDLRKQILLLRDILDIYSHNFSHELDLWDRIRDELDDGYTVVGAYKDLYDAGTQVEDADSSEEPEYKDTKELKKRRKSVLKWKDDFEDDEGIAFQLNSLLSSIRPLNQNNIKANSKYSDFFWGGVSVKPDPQATPAENAKTLLKAQFDVVAEEHEEVLEVDDLSKLKNEEIFHDHRKRIRTLVKICNLVAKFGSPICNERSLKFTAETVSAMGRIEDLVTAGRLQEESGSEKRADKVFAKANKEFSKLKSQWKTQDPLEIIGSL
jgi:hypothetical protein